MTIQVFPSGPFETNAYVLSCPITKDAAIIDPAPDSAPRIIQYLQTFQLEPQLILLTHSHWDHIADVHALLKSYPFKVLIHPNDAPNLEHPGTDKLPCWISIVGVKPDVLIHDGDLIPLGSLKLKVIETPGHTPGCVCFYEEEKNILFSGDTLFKGTIGNLSFPTAVPDLMWKSLDKLAKLPAATQVFSGAWPFNDYRTGKLAVSRKRNF